MTEEEQLAAQFDSHRCYLHALAYRMVGSAADADDAVQEAWLRLARTGGDEIEHLRGWLTTVITRICLDTLRKRGVRGEQPLEFQLGSPWGRRWRARAWTRRKKPCWPSPSALRCTS